MFTKKEIMTRLAKRIKENKLITAGIGLILISAVFLFIVFFPILKEEVNYQLRDKTLEDATVSVDNDQKEDNTIYPVDAQFSIIIPKLGANAKVIAGVDPGNSAEYQARLKEGVAHAAGSALPTQTGNVFLFAHSSQDFLTANMYNSVFYLISKLEEGDKIFIVYKEVVYEYIVKGSKVVNPSEVNYLTDPTSSKQLTLMTCWPAGLNTQRLLVFADLVES